MLHAFAVGFAFAAGVAVFCSILHRGLGRTIGGLLKIALMGAATLAAVVVIAVLLFRLIAVGNEPEPQASVRAPASNWLDEEQIKMTRMEVMI